jgi:hypothetical protein
MVDRNLARGLFLVAVALAFGLQAVQYPVRDFAHSGPGMFPLIVSSMLLVIGLITVIRSFLTTPTPLSFNFRNIGLIVASLCGFTIVSLLLNMTLGIVVLVFVSAFAASSYSISRNIKIAIGLIAVAFAFQRLLGLNLPLY